MKKFVLISAIAAVVSFVASDAASSKDLVMNVSGTVKYQNLENQYQGTVTSHSFNEKVIYAVITNAVANASNMSGGLISSATLPGDGYIAYNPSGYDTNANANIYGVFYVTNKEGFYFPLSGVDSTGTNYYSWIELDSTIIYGNNSGIDLGWDQYYNSATDYTDYLFNEIASYKINSSTNSSTYGGGSASDNSTALLYIHDDPYLFNDAAHPYLFTDYDTINFNYNENYLEIRGLLTANLKLTGFTPTSGTISLTGTGNFVYGDYQIYGMVSSGKVQLK